MLYLGLEPCCVWFLGMLIAEVAKIQSVWSWSVIVPWSGDFWMSHLFLFSLAGKELS